MPKASGTITTIPTDTTKKEEIPKKEIILPVIEESLPPKKEVVSPSLPPKDTTPIILTSKKERTSPIILPPDTEGEEGIDFVFDKQKRKIKVISISKERLKPEHKNKSPSEFKEYFKSLRGLKSRDKVNDEE